MKNLHHVFNSPRFTFALIGLVVYIMGALALLQRIEIFGLDHVLQELPGLLIIFVSLLFTVYFFYLFSAFLQPEGEQTLDEFLHELHETHAKTDAIWDEIRQDQQHRAN